MKRYVFDLESDGFLSKMTRIHVLCLFDMDTGEKLVFRNNDTENTIEEGVRLLHAAALIVGHNIIRFDIPAIKKLFPWFNPAGTILDTLVLVRIAAPDIKKYDFKLYNADKFDSKDIGSHSLKAWGKRMGLLKGDYDAEMRAKGLDPWAAWNQEMEDYCVQDVIVTVALWNKVLERPIDERCVTLEHEIHTLCDEMERNGFPFNLVAAEKLAQELKSEIDPLREKAIETFGRRHFVPTKRNFVRPLWYDPDGIMAKKEKAGKFYKPNPAYGEDKSRSWWGEVTDPKVNYTRQGVQYIKGHPFCKAVWQDFNPGSRPQIVELLTTKFGWIPTDFTETGRPSVKDNVLRVVAESVPVATDLAEYLFATKIYGALASGKNSWIKKYNHETGKIHAYTDTGGAVTGRCTHKNPNIGQVPSVVKEKLFNKDGSRNTKLLTPAGLWQPQCYSPDGNLRKEAVVFGRDGEYGWECRSLFYVPDDWVQVGIDLSGIEFRCLAELCAEFDGGELIDVVLNGDIHAYNQEKTGIPTRDIVKRVLYGLLYGAGDLKLGLTANPLLSIGAATALGKQMRAQLMEGLPALAKAIGKVKTQAKSGKLIGLDGRVLSVRSEHSALNTRLQSDGALIAKKWLVETRRKALEVGMSIGWEGKNSPGDFVMLAFVHDEQQNAVAPELAEGFANIAVEAAATAGKFFNFKCPIDAEYKIGKNWAECH